MWRTQARCRLVGGATSAGALLLMGLSGCTESKEATRVQVPVVADPSGLAAATNDLGWEVELSQAQLALRDLEFTTEGELHSGSAWLQRVWGGFVGTAHAHPGHQQLGVTTGELAGAHMVSWEVGNRPQLGVGTLLEGEYTAVNFAFRAADTGDGLDDTHPMFGHTLYFEGTARKEGVNIAFTAVVDAFDNRVLVGAPFEFTLDGAAPPSALGLRLLVRDPYEDDTLFDGIDFGALDPDSDGQVAILPNATEAGAVSAYDTLRKSAQTHDHYDVVAIRE
jgi:hypothetical protein